MIELFIHEKGKNENSQDYIKCDCEHKFTFNPDNMKKDKIICPKCKQDIKGYLESWMAIFNSKSSNKNVPYFNMKWGHETSKNNLSSHPTNCGQKVKY